MYDHVQEYTRFSSRDLLRFYKYRLYYKVKQSHNTPMGAQGERVYSSYSTLTSTLDGVSGQRHAPTAL
jgi:hypothetical protein